MIFNASYKTCHDVIKQGNLFFTLDSMMEGTLSVNIALNDRLCSSLPYHRKQQNPCFGRRQEREHMHRTSRLENEFADLTAIPESS